MYVNQVFNDPDQFINAGNSIFVIQESLKGTALFEISLLMGERLFEEWEAGTLRVEHCTRLKGVQNRDYSFLQKGDRAWEDITPEEALALFKIFLRRRGGTCDISITRAIPLAEQ